MTVTQPKWRQFCVEDGGLLESVFFAIKVTFIGFWLILTVRVDAYALGNLMGHCYVHLAFVFTLLYVSRD